MRINYSIVLVSDMERSVTFYRDVLGIPLKFESPEWTEFVTEGATLALHQGDAPTPDGETQGAERAGQCRAGFQVPNLDDFHKILIYRIKLAVLAVLEVLVVLAVLEVLAVLAAELFLNIHYNYHTASLEHLHY